MIALNHSRTNIEAPSSVDEGVSLSVIGYLFAAAFRASAMA